MPTMPDPTDEQRAALDLFATGEDLAIVAGAGAGKTTTLAMLATAAGEAGARGHYVAFNRAIVEDGKARFGPNVTCRTAHQLAYRAVGARFRHRLDAGRMRSDKVARLLGIGHLAVDKYDGSRKVIQPGAMAGLVQRAIVEFCFSADDAPAVRHVPWLEGIDPPDRSDGSANAAVREHVRPALARAWADLTVETGQLRFGHDHYLKLWQLGGPRIPGDFLLLDEAQDLSPVMLAAARAQEGVQLVYVGDSQQQIYAWRGAVDALETVDVGHTAYLTESFRFGPSVARIANRLLAALDAPLRLTGRGGPSEVVLGGAEPDAILTRTNAEAVTQVLRLQVEGRRPYLVGGAGDVVWFAEAAGRLQAGMPAEHPELDCFDSWPEVQAYVADDPQGGELKLLTDLVEEFGVGTIVAALKSMPEEAEADICVSTAHKAKGREWGTVALAGDFAEPDPADPGAAGEWRLLYVAATRARLVLDLGACEPLRGMVPVDAHARMTAAFAS